MKKSNHSILSERGIVTISLLVGISTIPLTQYIYKLEYASRSINQNYNGSYGGEVMLPFAFALCTYIVLNKIMKVIRRRHKYDM